MSFGRRAAFTRGNSVWARAFNKTLPRRLQCVFAGQFVGNLKMKFFMESPLEGFAEQYRLVGEYGLDTSDSRGEICQDAEEESAVVKDIITALTTLRSLGILRTYMISFTISQ